MLEAYLITLAGVVLAQAAPGPNLLAVGTFLFGAGLAAWQVVVFGPLAALSAMAVYGSYAYLFSSGLAGRAYARFARWIEAAFGLAFGALGGRLLLDGVREMRS